MADTIQVEFGAKIDQLLSGVSQAKTAIESVADSTSIVSAGATKLLGVFGALFSVDKIANFVEAMGNLGSQTERSMASLGVSAEKVGELSGEAKLTGTSMDGLSLSLERMAYNIQQSTRNAFGPQAQALQVLGLRARDLIGIPTDQYIDKLQAAVSRFNPSMNLTAAVMAIGGRGVAQMIPFLQQSTERFDQMREAIARTGTQMSAAQTGAFTTMDANIQLLSMSMSGLGITIMTKLGPGIDRLVTGAINVVQRFREWLAAGDDVATSERAWAVFMEKLWSAWMQFGLAMETVVAKAGIALPLLGYMLRNALNPFESNDAWTKTLTIAGQGLDALTATYKKKLAALQTDVKGALSNIALGTTPAAPGGPKQQAGAMNLSGQDSLNAALASIEGQIKVIQDGVATAKILYAEDVANFKMTKSEEAAAMIDVVKQAEAAEIAKYQAALTWGGLTLKMRQDLMNKIKELESTTNKEIMQLQAQQFEAQRTMIGGYINSIESSWNSSLRGMLDGTTTFGAAAKKVMGDFVLYAIEQFEKQFIFEQAKTALTTAFHVQAEVTKTAATTAGVAARTGAEQAGVLSSILMTIEGAVQTIMADAAKVFAGVFAFLAPTMGPAAAAPAGASMAAVMAVAGGIGHAEQGAWEVGGSGLAVIHQNEMILPAAAAQTFRSMAEGGGSAGGSTIHIHAIDSAGVMQFVSQYAQVLTRAVNNYQRLNPSTAG